MPMPEKRGDLHWCPGCCHSDDALPGLADKAARAVDEALRALNPDDPYTKQCYVASQVLWMLGGGADTFEVCSASLPDIDAACSHWWLRDKVTGKIYDPTARQFSFDYPYTRGRRAGWIMGIVPVKRADALLVLAKELLSG